MQPTIRWMKPLDNNKENALEKLFVRFANHWDIQFRRESRFFYEEDPSRPVGHAPRGYCPDFYLPRYRVYVEIYEGEKIHANRYEIKRKRQRIRWLTGYSGRVVVLIHLSNFPMDRNDFHNLIRRARQEARAHRLEVVEKGKICPLPHRHRSSKQTPEAA